MNNKSGPAAEPASLADISEPYAQRQWALEDRARLALSQARSWAFRSSLSKVLLIVVGALTATKAVSDEIWGSKSVGVTAAYALLGVATALIAGLDAAFKPEDRRSQFAALAAEALAVQRELETEAEGAFLKQRAEVRATANPVFRTRGIDEDETDYTRYLETERQQTVTAALRADKQLADIVVTLTARQNAKLRELDTDLLARGVKLTGRVPEAWE